jgi:hypothetical protein
MDRVELLIEEIRSQTQNTSYDANFGVPQSDFVRYLRNAQEFLFSQAVQQKPKFFLEEYEVDCVNDQEAYHLPARIYLGNIEMVEYSHSGNAREYYPLNVYQYPERDTTHTGSPDGYIRRNQEILLVPPAASGKLRISYIRERDRLDIRRGQISAVTDSGTQVTALTLDTSEESFDSTTLNKHYFLCVVDRNGVQKMENIEFDSIDSSTGVVTLTANHSYSSGETIAVGDYVVAGKFAANVSGLPDTCERFLIKHSAYEAKLGDSSKWSSKVKEDVIQMAEDIIGGFQSIENDIANIPITSTDYLDYGYQE